MPGIMGRYIVLTGGRTRPLQTHLVASGRIKFSGWFDDSGADGPVIRHLATGEIVAEWRRGAWSKPTREARELAPTLYPVPVFPAVQITLNHGKYY